MMVTGKPMQDPRTNEFVIAEDGVTPKREYWNWGDMQIVRWKFSKWPHTLCVRRGRSSEARAGALQPSVWLCRHVA